MRQPTPPPASFVLGLLLTALVAFGPMSTDLYLPSLPDMARLFHTDVGTAQLTLSVFAGGFAAGMLVHGPLSDRFGRRPVIVGALVLYVIASIACALAPTIEFLIGARFLQALAACAGPVIARAVVRDVYGRTGAARVLANMASAMALAPMVAPLLGGWLHVTFGWRANFVVLVGFGLVVLAGTIRGLAESNRELDPRALRPGHLLSTYAGLLRDPGYVAHTATVALIFAGLFAWISGSAFALIDVLGLAPDRFGYAFGVVVLGYVAGSWTGGRLGERVALRPLARSTALVGAAAGLAAAGLAWGGASSVPALVGPVTVYFFACGVLLPHAVAGAIAPFATTAGAASSLLGFAQMGTAAVAGALVGVADDGTTRPLATAIALAGLAGLVAAFRLPSMDRQPTATR